LASFFFGQKHLFVKMIYHRDSNIQKCFRRLCTACKSEEFRFPVSRPDDVSSRPDAHLSTVPSVRTTCHTVRTPDRPSIIRPDDVHFRPDPPLCREVSIQLASVRTTQQPVQTPLSTRPASDSFQVQTWED